MAFDVSRVERAVAKDKTVNESAITLLGSLSGLIRENSANEAKMIELADALDAQQDSLAAAVTANTPANGGGVTPAEV
jgi:hypothetical protein